MTIGSDIAARRIGPPGGLPSGPAPADPSGRRKSASDFEAMALDQMLQPMFSTLDASGSMFDGGAAEQMLRPMLVTEFAKAMEARGGLGLAEPITRALAGRGSATR